MAKARHSEFGRFRRRIKLRDDSRARLESAFFFAAFAMGIWQTPWRLFVAKQHEHSASNLGLSVGGAP